MYALFASVVRRTGLKNWVIAGLTAALAVSIATGVLTAADESARVHLNVAQGVDDSSLIWLGIQLPEEERYQWLRVRFNGEDDDYKYARYYVDVPMPEPTPAPTPTPTPEPEPVVDVVFHAEITWCDFHEPGDGETYAGAVGEYQIDHNFGPDNPPANRWGSYTATLRITIEDQNGRLLYQIGRTYDVGDWYWSVARLEAGDLTQPLHTALWLEPWRPFIHNAIGLLIEDLSYNSGPIDAGVTSITCRVYGALDLLPTLGSSEGSATRP